MENNTHGKVEKPENTTMETTSSVEKVENVDEPVKKEKKKRTAKSITGTVILTFGVASIISILFLTYLFFTGDIEIITAFFAITALLILTSVLMFFGNTILTLDEKERDVINEK